MSQSNIYQMITDRIIAQMQQGVIPWRKPWHSINNDNPEQVAVSHETGRPYSLLNQFLVGGPGEYISFGQIQRQGGRIRKGEKSRMVVFWTQLVKEDSDDLDTDGEPRRKVIPYLKYYNVWNIDQCEGITARWTKTADASAEPKVRPAEAAEAIVAGYLAQPSHPKLTLMAGDRAFYRPSADEVVVPLLSQYDSADEYYSTLFHELGHSTGHKDRLNRKGIADITFFGDHEYSKEELVAEITAAMLVAQAGLSAERAFKNSIAYLQSWLRALKDDPKMIVWAAGKAEAAARYILGEIAVPKTINNQ